MSAAAGFCPHCMSAAGMHHANCPHRGEPVICPVSSNPCHSPIHCGAVGCWRQKPVPWGPGATQERDMSESTNETVMADTGPVSAQVGGPAVASDRRLNADTGAGTLLREAAAIVDGKRTDGAPERVLQAIGSYWACYLRNERARVGEALAIGPAQVADMLALMKLARAQHGVSPVDSSVDMAGYAALAGEARAVKP